MTTAMRISILALTAFLLAATGCGYNTASLYPGDVSSVDVPIWAVGNDVYTRGLEFRLTEALKKRISLSTPYHIANRDTADTQLRGTIEKIERQVLSSNPDTGLSRETEVTITVSFVWADLRTGKERVNMSEFRASSTYIPHEPFSEEFFHASEDVVNELAIRIVEKLEADWPIPPADK